MTILSIFTRSIISLTLGLVLTTVMTMPVAAFEVVPEEIVPAKDSQSQDMNTGLPKNPRTANVLATNYWPNKVNNVLVSVASGVLRPYRELIEDGYRHLETIGNGAIAAYRLTGDAGTSLIEIFTGDDSTTQTVRFATRDIKRNQSASEPTIAEQEASDFSPSHSTSEPTSVGEVAGTSTTSHTRSVLQALSSLTTVVSSLTDRVFMRSAGLDVDINNTPNSLIEWIQRYVDERFDEAAELARRNDESVMDALSDNDSGGANLEESTSDDLDEGSSNLYYTDERVDDRTSTLLQGSGTINLTYDDSADTLTIFSATSSGEANTASNLGAGASIFAQKSGVDLQFRSLVAGTNVTLSTTSDEITISSTATTSPGGSDGQVQFNNSGTFDGTSNFFWDNTNDRLGIGTNSPSEALEVVGDIDISGSLKSGVNANSITWLGGNTLELAAKDNITFDIDANNNSAGTEYFAVDSEDIFKIREDGLVSIGTSTPSAVLDIWGDLRVGTSSTPTLFADPATGNVGIGTSSPASQFHVAGQSRFSSNIIFDMGDSQAYELLITGPSLGTQDQLMLRGQESGVPARLNIVNKDSDGTDDAELKIWSYASPASGSTYERMKIGYDSSNSIYQITEDASGVPTNNNPIHIFTESNNNQLVVDTNGNVGIGTTSPVTKLAVDGGATVTGAIDVAGSATSTFGGAMVVDGAIIPSTTDTYSLGSPTRQWQDLYLASSSLYINNQKVLQENSGTIVVSADSDQNLEFQTAGTGDVELNPTGTGVIQMKGDVQVTQGFNIQSSNAAPILFSDGISTGNISVSANSVEATNTNGSLELVATGTGAVFVSEGRFGIGDTSPDHELDVDGNIGLTAGGYVNWGDTSGSSGYGIRDNSGTLEFKNSGGSWSSFGSGGSGEANDGTSLGAGEAVYTGMSGTSLQFKSLIGGTNVTLSSDSNEITIDATDTNTDTFTGLTDTAGSFTSSAIPYTNAAGDALAFTSDFVFTGSRLGVGTSSPSAILEVVASGSIPRFRVGTATSSLYALEVDGNDKTTVGSGSGNIYFNLTNGTNVGIGTTSPAADLTLAGEMLFAGSNRYLNFGTATSSAGYGFRDNAGTLEYKDSGGAWTSLNSGASSEELKENFLAVNSASVLAGINQLDIRQWNYSYQKDEIQHIGPSAEEFYAQFGLNGTDESISFIDTGGVALVGIQALSRRINDLEAVFGTSTFSGDTASSTDSGGGGLIARIVDRVIERLGAIVENGKARFTQLVTDEIVLSTNSDDDELDPSAGAGTILPETAHAEIENNRVATSTKIFITFTSDTGTSTHWVDKEREKFTVHLSATTTATTTFDYLLVQTEDRATSTEQTASTSTKSSDGGPDLGPIIIPRSGTNSAEKSTTSDDKTLQGKNDETDTADDGGETSTSTDSLNNDDGENNASSTNQTDTSEEGDDSVDDTATSTDPTADGSQTATSTDTQPDQGTDTTESEDATSSNDTTEGGAADTGNNTDESNPDAGSVDDEASLTETDSDSSDSANDNNATTTES